MSLARGASSQSSAVLGRRLFQDGSIVTPAPRRVVVVAPHPDDETLGAGGLIFDLVRTGCEVTVVVVTDGAASHPEIPDLSRIRKAECSRAITILGVTAPPVFLDFPDGRAQEQVHLIADALLRVASWADVVVGPRIDDGHDDHCAVARAIAFAYGGPDVVQLRYAIWGWEQLSEEDLGVANGQVFRPSPEGTAAKRLALEQYVSQTSTSYGRSIVDHAMVERAASGPEVFWS